MFLMWKCWRLTTRADYFFFLQLAGSVFKNAAVTRRTGSARGFSCCGTLAFVRKTTKKKPLRRSQPGDGGGEVSRKPRRSPLPRPPVRRRRRRRPAGVRSGLWREAIWRYSASPCACGRGGELGRPPFPSGEERWAALFSPEARNAGPPSFPLRRSRTAGPGPLCEGGRVCGQPAASDTAGGGLWRVRGAVKPPPVSPSSRSVKPLRGWLMLLTGERTLFFLREADSFWVWVMANSYCELWIYLCLLKKEQFGCHQDLSLVYSSSKWHACRELSRFPQDAWPGYLGKNKCLFKALVSI